eukprot:7111305-Prymnesium_polylepis.1
MPFERAKAGRQDLDFDGAVPIYAKSCARLRIPPRACLHARPLEHSRGFLVAFALLCRDGRAHPCADTLRLAASALALWEGCRAQGL